MCGICGYAGFERDELLLRRMTGTMVHRGPDSDGLFLSKKAGLGMRRLSIIDVAGGHQPIFNEDKSVALVFNGEIYNYRPLMRELEGRGHRFQARSDGEVIVHLYEDHGMECLEYLRGMFSFALYDTSKECLYVARDRLGIKPLYYWAQNGKLLFGSEIKAVLESDYVAREPNLTAMDSYLSLRYVPAPDTLFAGIHKLPAAHWLSYRDGRIDLKSYWHPRFVDGPYQPDDYYRERFAELFTETTRMHLESDVPLGAYLSGGVDSSAIVATMASLTDRPVETFSVGFDWPGDELPAAREVARSLGCNYHEVICRPEDIALLPQIVWHLDEAFGDAIVLPMFLLSRLARQHVKVVLSGEGGDETLAGYFFHKVMFWAGKYARFTPDFAQRNLVGPLMSRVPASLLNRAFDYPAQLGERGRRKVLDYLNQLTRHAPQAEYRFLTSLFDGRDKADLYDGEMRPILNASAQNGSNGNAQYHGSNYLSEILSLQYAHWLPDNILMKADKTSMANSVEGRVPFMDHKLVEFLFETPPHLKLKGLKDKLLLREYLGKVLPGDHARRPKKPFYIPFERYFATQIFRDLVAACLSEKAVRKRGYFSWEGVSRLLRSVRDNDFLYGKQVLALVMLELWFQIFIDRNGIETA